MTLLRWLVLLLLAFAAGFGARETLLRTATPSVVVAPSPTATATLAPTATLTPSATPLPQATEPPAPTPRKPIEKVTKMGVGVYARGGGHIIDMLYQAAPTVILLQDPDAALAKDVRYWFPKAFIIGRIFVANKDQVYQDDPARRGADFADRVAAVAVPLKGVVDAWMSYNEAVAMSSGAAALRAYGAFELAFVRRLQGTHGIPAVVGNFGVGAIDEASHVTYFADAIREARYLGVHAYASRESKSMMDDPRGSEWFALRYRKAHQAIVAAGIKRNTDRYIVLTESGLWDGWRDVVSEERMANDFIWLTNELERDAYVIGHAAFGIFADDDSQWRRFELAATSILDRLGAYWPSGRGS